MRKLFLTLSILVLFRISSGCADGSDDLVCDVPTAAVGLAEVEITWNGQTSVSGVTPTVVGSDLVLMDVAAFEPGLYTFRARFLGAAGVPTDWSAPMLRMIRHGEAWSARNYSAAAMDGF